MRKYGFFIFKWIDYKRMIYKMLTENTKGEMFQEVM